MAEVELDHNAYPQTVDDVFQILVARDIPPLRAKRQIIEALQLGHLLVNWHIAGGANKTHPTAEGRKAQREGRSADVVYEVSPPGGITEPVHPQSWDGGIFFLAIRDGHLIVEPQCSLDWRWAAISISIANPVVIDHLWPPATSAPASPTGLAADAERPPLEASKVTHLAWAYARLLERDELAGLRGKKLLKAVCAEVGPKFSAGETSLKQAIRQYRKKEAARHFA